jgi:hypothetical protein
MKLLRTLTIILLAISTGFNSDAPFLCGCLDRVGSGYYIATAVSDVSQPTLIVSQPLHVDDAAENEVMLNQFLNPELSQAEPVVFMNEMGSPAPRTWVDWFGDKLAMQLQCSLSAVMMARWLSSALFGRSVEQKV